MSFSLHCMCVDMIVKLGMYLVILFRLAATSAYCHNVIEQEGARSLKYALDYGLVYSCVD